MLKEVPLAFERKNFKKKGRAANVALQQMRLCFREEYRERKKHRKLFREAKGRAEVKLLEEVVYKRRVLLGEEAELTVEAKEALGLAYRDRRDYSKAEGVWRELYEHYKRKRGLLGMKTLEMLDKYRIALFY